MPEITSTDPQNTKINTSRRRFFSLLPFGILAGMAGTMVATAFRFLRPINRVQSSSWTDVSPVSDLKGARPILKRVITEVQAAWSTSTEEHFVYVIPGNTRTVLSSVCPHEGCNVAWNDGNNGFVCPCHDSLFAADGSYIKGPARRGLDPLPTREQDGVLQIQYLSFVNNTSERKVLE